MDTMSIHHNSKNGQHNSKRSIVNTMLQRMQGQLQEVRLLALQILPNPLRQLEMSRRHHHRHKFLRSYYSD